MTETVHPKPSSLKRANIASLISELFNGSLATGSPISRSMFTGSMFLGSLLGCAAAFSATSFSTAQAENAVVRTAKRPLDQAGRYLGVGWGDGYQACKGSGLRPGADCPPRSSHAIAARSAGHKHGSRPRTFYDHFDNHNVIHPRDYRVVAPSSSCDSACDTGIDSSCDGFGCDSPAPSQAPATVILNSTSMQTPNNASFPPPSYALTKPVAPRESVVARTETLPTLTAQKATVPDQPTSIEPLKPAVLKPKILQSRVAMEMPVLPEAISLAAPKKTKPALRRITTDALASTQGTGTRKKRDLSASYKDLLFTPIVSPETVETNDTVAASNATSLPSLPASIGRTVNEPRQSTESQSTGPRRMPSTSQRAPRLVDAGQSPAQGPRRLGGNKVGGQLPQQVYAVDDVSQIPTRIASRPAATEAPADQQTGNPAAAAPSVQANQFFR